MTLRRCGGLVLAALLAVTAGCSSASDSATTQATSPRPAVVSPRLATPRGYVALTYDDGPDPTYTPKLLDHLAAHEAPATFFVEGRDVDPQAELIRRQVDEGHKIGNHTFDHANLLSLSPEEVERQIRSTTEALEELGVTPVLFRPPYDAHDERIDEIVRDEALTMVIWSYSADPRDWEWPGDKGKPSDEVCRAVVEKARAGDVILLHDRLAGTVAATPCIIRGLREERLEPGRIVLAATASRQNAGSRIRVAR